MPAPRTSDEYLELVRKSDLVDENRLLAHLDQLRAAGPLPASPPALAGLLVRDGLLSGFQAEQLLLGKWRGFFIGKYKVLERLGAGSTAGVYLCEHQLVRRKVALKVLPPARAEDPVGLERFYREARAGAAMYHPNVVQAYDIYQDDKLHFLVTEYVDGNTLEEVVLRDGPLEWGRAAHSIRQAALGLQHVHEMGVVHRDVRPGNLLMDRQGVVKVFDFGLAAFLPEDREASFTAGFVGPGPAGGAPDYLAPEQTLNYPRVDHRADVYGLGVTLYFCLTARPPFPEGTVAQKLTWLQTRQPTPLRTLRPEVPEGLAAVVEKMMARDPAQRYQTAAASAAALEPWTPMSSLPSQ